jgi:hypothetical protein
MTELTQSRRTDVIKQALVVYHWFIRQSLSGSRVISKKATGEEITFETAELALLSGKSNRPGAEEKIGAARIAAFDLPFALVLLCYKT